MTKSYIPTINISSLLKNNFDTLNATKTLKKIEKACVDIGFFQITGHELNLNQIKETCKIANKFFNLTDKEKKKLSPKKNIEVGKTAKSSNDLILFSIL